MNTVKDALAQKSGALIHVRSGDMVVEALRQMRDNRVRSVLVIDDDVLVGIVTQGDCAIKVLLPGLDAKQNSGGPSDDGRPGDGQAGRPTGRLHGNDVCARLSPSTSAERGQGRGHDLDRRRRQGHHPKFGAQRGRPDWLHHDGRPRGLTDEPRGAVAGVREGKRRGTVKGPPSSCRGDCIVPAQANVLIELRLASRCNIKRQPMSALGLKQTRRGQIVMSALPPIAAAAVADRRGS